MSNQCWDMKDIGDSSALGSSYPSSIRWLGTKDTEDTSGTVGTEGRFVSGKLDSWDSCCGNWCSGIAGSFGDWNLGSSNYCHRHSHCCDNCCRPKPW